MSLSEMGCRWQICHDSHSFRRGVALSVSQIIIDNDQQSNRANIAGLRYFAYARRSFEAIAYCGSTSRDVNIEIVSVALPCVALRQTVHSAALRHVAVLNCAARRCARCTWLDGAIRRGAAPCGAALAVPGWTARHGTVQRCAARRRSPSDNNLQHSSDRRAIKSHCSSTSVRTVRRWLITDSR